jgi:hypothetical protein
MKLNMIRILSVLLFLMSCLPAAPPTKRIAFDSAAPASEHKWTLKELGLPSALGAGKFLVLEMRASSPQRFQLKLYAPDGEAAVRLHLYPNAWIRAAIPLTLFTSPPREGIDMAAVYNKSRLGYYINLGGPYRSLDSVEALGFVMQEPLASPVLEIRSMRVTDKSPGDAVLESDPLVDEFGQYIRAEWPGKATTLEQLQQAWKREEESLKPGEFGYCKYGGYQETKAKATGFFRVEEIGGRWWLVDPDGHLFFSVGSDVVTPWMNTPTEGRSSVFKALPPAEIGPPRIGRRREPGASFYAWNLFRRFGPEWPAQWVDVSIRRMQAWGLNTVANWSDAKLWDAHRIPYTIPLRDWQTKVSYMGLPDVYSEEFVVNANRAAAAQCASRKDDPWLLGYFLANEPPWPGREGIVVEMILSGPDTPTKQQLKRYLAQGDTPDRRRAFVYTAFEKYIEVVNAAVRKHDPNHLNLGMRFGGHPPEEMSRAARAFDVYSINIYDYSPGREAIDRAYALAGRPVMIGEFHIGTPGRGLSAGLRQARDYKERGVAYQYYVENAAAMPAMVGAHWFQWADEPATGRGDGENYNIGLVDVTDSPYDDMIESLRTTHRRLHAVHSGKEPAVDRKPIVH